MTYLLDSGSGLDELGISCELLAPAAPAVVHYEISGEIFTSRFCFEQDASGPLVPKDPPTESLVDGLQSFTVVLSRSPSRTYKTAGNEFFGVASSTNLSITWTIGPDQPTCLAREEDHQPLLEPETYRFTGKPYSSATGLYYSFSAGTTLR